MVTWTEHPEQWPIWWQDYEVRCKNPDRVVIAKMLDIASALKARAVGDDGEEYYRAADGTIHSRPYEPPPEEKPRPRRSRWQQLIDRLNGFRPEE
jgi:hypothetical protein